MKTTWLGAYDTKSGLGEGGPNRRAPLRILILDPDSTDSTHNQSKTIDNRACVLCQCLSFLSPVFHSSSRCAVLQVISAGLKLAISRPQHQALVNEHGDESVHKLTKQIVHVARRSCVCRPCYKCAAEVHRPLLFVCCMELCYRSQLATVVSGRTKV